MTLHPIELDARPISCGRGLRMRGVSLFALAGLLVGCGGDDGSGAPTASNQDACSALTSAQTTDYSTTGIQATYVDASASAPFTVPTTTTTVTQPFCRLVATTHANANSNIGFELWMPAREQWNRKFAGTASGGSAGSISYGTVAAHFRSGYASIGHDNGHVSTGFSQTWAYDPATQTLKNDQIVDWAYRAQHVVTVVAKELTAKFYGEQIQHAYYDGCSQSGHHGMMEAQRYPDDYDGIVAGAHTSEWTTNMATQAWVAAQQFGNGGAGAITKAQYAAVHTAVLAACDGKPGVDHLVDGVLDDPRLCTFDPVVLQCTGSAGDPATCLKPAQVQSLRAMYAGHKTPSGDTTAYPYAIGSETGTFWPNNTTTPTVPQGSWADYFRYPVFVNPNYDFATLNFDVDPYVARAKLRPTYDAYSTDLSAFQKRGGKLLMYHGFADSLISPYLSIDYWTGLRQTMSVTEVDKFARFYLVPGVDHCGGGTGTGTFSMVDALAAWVEQGIAPDATNAQNTIVGSGSDGRTRPLCPYPKIARYSGSGDVKLAVNFTCQAP